MEFFKRKKVTNQERASNLTLEQLKQSTDVRFNEVYDYLDQVANNMFNGTIEGNVTIKGDANVTGDIIHNGQEILEYEVVDEW